MNKQLARRYEACHTSTVTRIDRRVLPFAFFLVPFVFFLLPFLAACQATGGEAERLNQEGNERYRAGDFNGALESYQRGAAERPDLTALNYNAGNALHRMGQLDRAVRESQRAAANGSNDVRFRAYYALGNHFAVQQRWREAYESYRNALVLNPGDLDTKYNLEIALARLDQQTPPQARQPQPSANQGNQGDPQQGQGQGQPQSGQPDDGQGQPPSQGNPGQGTQQPGQGGQQPAQGGQPSAGTPGQTGAQPGSTQGRAPTDQEIKDALAQFERNLTIEDAMRILDLLAQQQRERQAQVPGPPPGSNIRDQ